jgi:DNA-binding NarL/FixJ family response regulator
MVAASRIILLGQNLFFQGRIETVAEPLGYSVRQAHTEADFWDNYAEGETELVLVDLEGDADTWSSVLTGLGQRAAQGEAADLRIVAFGPHEDLASMEKAAALGAQQTLNKGRFSATLGEIVGGGG